ncbi:MAG: transglutaminase domain-containing protein [Oscillospiraceae bacterium]|nr:transglutaminase domain-containing protein [Oscillospiraceae bacterium]
MRNKTKNSAKQNISVNGTGFTVGLHIDSSEKTGLAVRLFRTALALIGTVGSVMCFLSATNPEFGVLPVMAAAAAGVLCCLAASFFPRAGSLIISGGYIVTAIAALKLREACALGFQYLFNNYYSLMSVVFRDVEFYDISDFTAEEKLHGALALIVIITLLIALTVGLFMVYRTSVVVVFAATFPLLEAVLYFGMIPDHIYAAFVIVCWAGSAAAEISEFPVSGRSRTLPTYARSSGQSAACCAALFMLCFAGASAALDISGYERPEKLNNMRSDISNYMKNFSWDRFVSDVSALSPINTEMNGAINHGKLGRSDDIEFTDEVMLTVTMPKSADNVYLKGFVGAVYTGSSWKELSGDALDEQDNIISGFETMYLTPSFLDGYSLKEYIGISGDNISINSVTVENIGANRRFSYLPYFITPAASGGIDIESDKASPEKRITAESYAITASKRYGFLQSGFFADRYLTYDTYEALYRDEEKYRRFVYETYLDIPETFTAAEYIYGEMPVSYLNSELSSIKSWLAANCEYDLSAGRLPFGKDFAQYFLTENRRGSCSHFATAAALMCRYRGIPTRYAEGYVIKPEDFPEDADIGETVTVELKDDRAHAWIEVYLDGYGWFPYEVTPGYEEVISSGSSNKKQQGNEAAVQEMQPLPQPETQTETELITETETQTETELSETEPDDIDIGEPDDISEETAEEFEPPEEESVQEPVSSEKRHINLTPIIIVVSVLLTVTLFFAVRYHNIAGTRRKRFCGKSSKNKAYAAGKYFISLCAYKKVTKRREQSYEEFGAEAEERIPELEKGSAEIILNAALRSKFGGNAPDHETADNAVKCVVKFADSIYENLNGRDKLIFKYFYCLK